VAFDIHRKKRCQHYGDCLSHAVKSGWPGFSCEWCPDYLVETMDPVEAEQQAGDCASLLVASLKPGAVERGNRRRLIDPMV
jgi:hypothetical protein